MARAASAAALLLPLSCAVGYYSKEVAELCPRCLQSGGESHVCEKTTYCPSCRINCASLKAHRCYQTRYCRTCGRDVGLQHACGLTSFCETCVQEAGEGHVCGRTRFCRACGKEVPRPHAH